MKQIVRIVILLSFSLIFLSCKSSTGSDKEKSSIKIEWITPVGGETQYERVRNNVGLIIGLRFNAEFEVVENSGNITINIPLVDVDTDNEKSISKDVVEGSRYAVSAYAEIVSTSSCDASSVAATVTFESPSSSEDKVKTVLNWIQTSLPYASYCVNLRSLTDISITAL